MSHSLQRQLLDFVAHTLAAWFGRALARQPSPPIGQRLEAASARAARRWLLAQDLDDPPVRPVWWARGGRPRRLPRSLLELLHSQEDR